MKNSLRNLSAAALLAAVSAAGIPTSGFAEYPERTVEIVVPTGSGSSTSDQVTRFFAEQLSAALGQQFIINNRPGANGTIGSAEAARAEPDGYTLLTGSNGALTIGPNIMPDIPYDPATDFTPIAMLSSSPFILVVPASSPAQDIAGLIALAKEKPGMLKYGSTGVGSSAHLAAEMLSSMAGIEMVNVPYSGNAEVMPDLLAGRLDLFMSGIGGLYPYIESGQLRAIAMATVDRSSLLPDLPTLDESGMKGFEVTTWVGLLGPANMPQDVTDKLASTLETISSSDAGKAFLDERGLIAAFKGPAEFGPYIDAERQRWKELIDGLGGLQSQ